MGRSFVDIDFLCVRFLVRSRGMFLAVYGDDALRVREFSEDLLEKFYTKYDPSRLNGEVLDFSACTKESIVGALCATPFLAEKRFILLKNVADVLKKSDAEFWFHIFDSLHDQTVVCFVDVCEISSWKKSVFGSTLSQREEMQVKHYALAPFTKIELFQWIQLRAAKYSSRFSDGALTLLCARVGNSCDELAHEIHKVALYASRETISEDMVARLVPMRTSSDFFGFLDAVSVQSPQNILRVLSREMDSGTDAFALFGGLLRQLRVFVSVSHLVRSGVTDQKAIAEILAIHPFVAQKALSSLRSFSHDSLCSLLSQAHAWDRQTKQGFSAQVLVERLLEGLLFARVSRLP